MTSGGFCKSASMTTTASPLGQTGRQGNLVPEIARQRDHPHARIGTLEHPQDIQRAVVAAVVHIDDFEIQAGDPASTPTKRLWVSRMTATSSKQETTTERRVGMFREVSLIIVRSIQ